MTLDYYLRGWFNKNHRLTFRKIINLQISWQIAKFILQIVGKSTLRTSIFDFVLIFISPGIYIYWTLSFWRKLPGKIQKWRWPRNLSVTEISAVYLRKIKKDLTI